jgi:hypothetical protein
MVIRSTSYRLRSSGPQAISNTCSAGNPNEADPSAIDGFVMQTFMAEEIITDTCGDKEQILCSTDMIGLGGNYTSASYTAQRFVDPTSGNIVFQATETYDRIIIDEDDVPGASAL